MKNASRILPFLTFFLVASSSFAQELANKPKTLVIQANDVLLRESPATGKMILMMKAGSVCTYFTRKDFEIINGKPDYWYEAEYNGKRGWVFGGLTSVRLYPKEYVVSSAQEIWDVYRKVYEEKCKAPGDCKGVFAKESEKRVHCYCKPPGASDRWQENPFFFVELGAKIEKEIVTISVNDHLSENGVTHHINKVSVATFRNNSWQMRMADDLPDGFRWLIPWGKQQKLIVTADRSTVFVDTTTIFLMNMAQGSTIARVGMQRIEEMPNHLGTTIDSIRLDPVTTGSVRALKYTIYRKDDTPYEMFLYWDPIQNKFVKSAPVDAKPVADDTASVKGYFRDAFLVKTEIDVFMDCTPTLDECKKLFTGANAETYFNYQQAFLASGAKEIEQERKRGIKKNYGVKARAYSIDDLKKSTGGDRLHMGEIADKLVPGTIFYEVEIQRGDNINSFGTSTVKFIAKAGNRYVILNKAWGAFQ